jgi:hypothetical protein
MRPPVSRPNFKFPFVFREKQVESGSFSAGRQAALPWPRGLPETWKRRLTGVPLRFYFYAGRNLVGCAFPVVWCVQQFFTLTAKSDFLSFLIIFPTEAIKPRVISWIITAPTPSDAGLSRST